VRIGLVLGAGGVVGASWLVGALEALEAETGWSATEADAIVGTSAGAVVGALTAAGIAPEYMSAYIRGREVDAIAEAAERADTIADRADSLAARAAPILESLEAPDSRPDGGGYRLQLSAPPIGPGSWRLAVSTLLHPLRHSATAVLAGWLPRGFISPAPITQLIETFIPDTWPDHPSYWAVAADYRTGKRVPFGRPDAPPATVGEAVAASCAIPGFYHPVSIAGRRYVDGGVCSLSNLDLLCDAGLDLVVCLNPMTSVVQASGGSPADRIGALVRGIAHRRLAHEARKLRGTGTELLVLEPTAGDLEAMGLNMMSRRRRVQVVETALRTTAVHLRELRGTRQAMPGRRRARRARSAARHAA